MTPIGFPHSEFSGSQLLSSSPKLIAGLHVLLRLLMPRHPPVALSSLNLQLSYLNYAYINLITIKISQTLFLISEIKVLSYMLTTRI